MSMQVMSRAQTLRTCLAVCLLAGVARGGQPKEPPQTEPRGGDSELNEVPGTGSLMPLRFTTSGNFFYMISSEGRDDFRVETLQLDLSLELNRYVDVSAGLTYDGAQNTFGVGSFTIDCGLAGSGSHYLLQSGYVERSGIVFGRFDVPFGIAYLEYSPVDNRLVTQPEAVLATHGAWNDVGAQLYLAMNHVNFIGYVLNGDGVPDGGEGRADDALGARLGFLPFEALEIGASGAIIERSREVSTWLGGADLAARPGNLDVRLEYIGRFPFNAPEVHGSYARALYRLGRVFATGRYGVVFHDNEMVQRELAAGVGMEVFPKGEIRVVHQRDLDALSTLTFIELVGGSSWQPTGFRR
jgi:hypothetical protein